MALGVGLVTAAAATLATGLAAPAHLPQIGGAHAVRHPAEGTPNVTARHAQALDPTVDRCSTGAMIPRLHSLDSTASFLLDGYTFGSRLFRRLGTDAFRTRMMLKPVVFMQGSDASRLFYEGRRFTRTGALPPSVLHLLQDEGSVQLLDGREHDHRKLMLLTAMRDESAQRLMSIFREEWQRAATEWVEQDDVELHSALLPVLTVSAAKWAGVPLDDHEVSGLADDLSSMVENAGAFGPPNWAARARRARTEEWARGIIRRARSGEIEPATDTALRAIVDHVDTGGDPLDDAVAAVELLNVLRPTVAVGRFIVFAALALHRHPKWARAFASTDESDLGNFVHEVRRFYPFFPVVGGRATQSFEWNGHRFDTGDWVLLDLYGTNHDDALWSDPYRFKPERFRDWNGDQNTLIPQGGGDVEHGHRCPGEPITNELVKEAIRLLTRHLVYSVPDQDLRVSLRRFPAIPESGLIMRVGGVG